MVTLQVMYVLSGLLLSGLAIPLILRKVGPNPVYGFRLKQTLEDPAVWYDVNAVAGKGMLIDGLAVALAAVVLPLAPGVSVDRYAISVTAILILSLGITLVVSFRELARMTSDKERTVDQKTPGRRELIEASRTHRASQ